MNLTALQVHKPWLIRAVLVLVLTVLADGATAWFVPQPLVWCTLIASSLPISMVVFVIFPILRQEGRKS